MGKDPRVCVILFLTKLLPKVFEMDTFYTSYDNRIQYFLRDSSICGEVLIHKNSSPSLRGLRRLPGAPYGPNRSDWAFALLRTAPRPRRKEPPKPQSPPHLFQSQKRTHATNHCIKIRIERVKSVDWSRL